MNPSRRTKLIWIVLSGVLFVGLSLVAGLAIDEFIVKPRERRTKEHGRNPHFEALIVPEGDDLRFVEPLLATRAEADATIGFAWLFDYDWDRGRWIIAARYERRRGFYINFADDRAIQTADRDRLRDAFRDHLLATWPTNAKEIDAILEPEILRSGYLWIGLIGNGAVALLVGYPLILVVLGVFIWSPPTRRQRRLGAGRCPCCRYEIRGLPSCRCPECGETWSDDELPEHLRSYDPAQQKTS